MKSKKYITAVIFVILILINGALFAQGTPIGKWKTIDDETKEAKSYVEIYEKDGVIFGKITKLIGEPQDKLCEKCKGSRHNQPIVGMTFLWDMKKDGDVYKGGKILDPKNGKTYKCKMWVEGGKLKVRGYIAFFYRTQYWFRVK